MLDMRAYELKTSIIQRTWLNCVYPSLRQQVVVVGFGPPQPADCQPTLVQFAGTLYRTI